MRESTDIGQFSISIIEAIGDIATHGVFVYNLSSARLDYVNDALAGIFDISHKAFQHQYSFFLNHVVSDDMDYLQQQMAALKRTRRIENVQFRINTHEKGIRTVVCHCYVVNDRVAGFVRDITHERQHQEYIVDFGAKKNSLLDMITHNLSGLLSVSHHILVSLERAVKERENEHIMRHVRLIRENTNHCIEIVNDFLREEHFTSEFIYTQKVRFDIVAKVLLLVESMRSSYEDREFVFSSNINSLIVYNDEVKFLQVINNLMSNAIKFTPSGGRIELKVEELEEAVMVIVCDNGIGIPPHLEPFLFEKYSRAVRTGLKGERPVGMGLYIVKNLLNLMNGTIDVRTRENAGTEFRIRLPR